LFLLQAAHSKRLALRLQTAEQLVSQLASLRNSKNPKMNFCSLLLQAQLHRLVNYLLD
jgi:hypothetical protein